jgi:ferrous iron transport protein B
MRDPASPAVRPRLIALTGNPNSGKSTVFNALTGLRQRVSNYPGVTVERKEGRIRFDDGSVASVVDLPGTYSFVPTSLDERITVDVLLGKGSYSAPPDLVVCVVDANSLERNLYLVSQIIDREIPVVVALNMIDVAKRRGSTVNAKSLQRELGVPVIPMVASRGKGIPELKQILLSPSPPGGNTRRWKLPEPMARECEELSALLRTRHELTESEAIHEALVLLSPSTATHRPSDQYDPEVIARARSGQRRLEFLDIDPQSAAVSARYGWVQQITLRTIERVPRRGMTRSDRIDWLLTHRIWGVVIFLAVMALIFQSIFSWAMIPMEMITIGFDWIGQQMSSLLPPGDVRDLLVNGALAGVAAVVTFLPQIMLLFFFLGILEDTARGSWQQGRSTARRTGLSPSLSRRSSVAARVSPSIRC